MRGRWGRQARASDAGPLPYRCNAESVRARWTCRSVRVGRARGVVRLPKASIGRPPCPYRFSAEGLEVDDDASRRGTARWRPFAPAASLSRACRPGRESDGKAARPGLAAPCEPDSASPPAPSPRLLARPLSTLLTICFHYLLVARTDATWTSPARRPDSAHGRRPDSAPRAYRCDAPPSLAPGRRYRFGAPFVPIQRGPVRRGPAFAAPRLSGRPGVGAAAAVPIRCKRAVLGPPST